MKIQGLNFRKCFSRGCMVLLAPFVIVTLLQGCSFSQFAKYRGNSGLNLANMKKFQYKDMNFMLPSDWKKQDTPDISTGSKWKDLLVGDSKAVQFNKNTNGQLYVFCWEGMVGGGLEGYKNLKDIAEGPVDEYLPDNKVIVGPYEIEGSGSFGPAFEIFRGVRIIEGEEVPFRAYIAWKGGFGFGCKYTMFAMSPEGEDIQDEFLGVVRSLE